MYCTMYLNYTGYTSQSSKFIGGRLAMCFGDYIQQCRFANAGKSDESDASIATFHDVKTFTLDKCRLYSLNWLMILEHK